MGIKKSDEVLLEAAEDLGRTYDTVTNMLASMRSKVEAAAAEGFQGRGGTAFAQTLRDWDRAAGQVTGHMENFRAALVQTEEDYSVTEDVVSQEFTRYAEGLGGA